MTKHRIFINIDKEETWINSVVSQGYRLKNVTSFGKYVFENYPAKEKDASAPENGTAPKNPQDGQFLPLVRMDFRTFSKKQDFIEYLTLFEDAGWRHVSGSKSEGNQYFERMRPDCQEEIFSDSASRAGRYRRLSEMWMALFAVYLPLLIVYLNAPPLDVSSWKDLFYTPGLWESSGAEFWMAFLFELPFALGRAIGGLFPLMLLITVICFGYFSFQTFYWYRKEQKR